MNNLPDCTNRGYSKTPPPFLASVPVQLWRPVYSLRSSKKRKRHGKRGGIFVKLKSYLASCVDDRGPVLSGGFEECGSYDLRRSREYSYRWLKTAIPDDVCLLPCRRPVRIRMRGCVQGNLRPLSWAPKQSCRAVSAALLNARSLTNKSFILNNFIFTRDLDFFLLKETWLKQGEQGLFRASPSQLLFPEYAASGPSRWRTGCGF